MNRLNVYKKLFKDPWAIISSFYIFFLIIVAVFAYQIAPDNSFNANQMHLSIHSMPPGFKTKIVVIEQNKKIEKKHSFFYGQSNTSLEIPIKNYLIEDEGVRIQPYGYNDEYYEYLDNQSVTSHNFESDYLIEKIFPLGTDMYGRDLLSRLIIGTRISLTIGFIAVFISLIIGIIIGGIGGYFGGEIDKLILWLINVFWSIPTLLTVIAITLALGRGFWQVFIAVGLTMWVEVARIVRGQILSLKEKNFINSAKVLGYNNFRILFNHILPLIVPPLIVTSAANFASAILIESGLSFLGIGAQPPIPSWGGMVKDHFRYLLLGKPYLTLLPGLTIMSLVLAFMTLGNSLRDALDIKN